MADDAQPHSLHSTMNTTLVQVGTAGLLALCFAVTIARRRTEHVVGLRAVFDGKDVAAVLPFFAEPARYLSFARQPTAPTDLDTSDEDDGSVCHAYQTPGPTFNIHQIQRVGATARVLVSSKSQTAPPQLLKYEFHATDSPSPGTKVLLFGKLDAPWYKVRTLAQQLQADEQHRLERIIEAVAASK